jgi:hypothetical protein
VGANDAWREKGELVTEFSYIRRRGLVMIGTLDSVFSIVVR